MSEDTPIKELLAAIESVRFRDFTRIDPTIAARIKKLRFIPFQVSPDFGREYVSAIDPGPVSPTYVHSWAIDVQGFKTFRFAVAKDALALNWNNGDEVLVYVPETGQTTKIASAHDLRTQPVELNPVPSTSPARIYVILRTSTARWSNGTERSYRRFRVEGVYPLDAFDDPRAVLVGDDLNYDTNNAPNQDPWLDDGTKSNPLHGWIQGENTLSGAEVEPPRPEEGWYLLGRFTPPPGHSADMDLYTLVYYNEQVSRLRLYVLPKPQVAATGLEARLRLLGRTPGSGANYDRLEGAFFDDDSRPHTWSEARLIVPTLTSNKWTMVETSFLYPMAKDLPCGKDTSGLGLITDEGVITTEDPRFPSQQDWFKPIYDSTFEGFESWMGNIRLQVELTPFERGTANLDFIGEGVGQAIQAFNSQGDSFLKSLKDSVGSSIETGKEAYGAAKWVYDKTKESHKKAHPNLPLPGLLALGVGAFAGPVTAVAAGIAFFAKAFSSQEALRLALELKIRGSITGSIYTPLAKTVFDCYLPGRFDAREMHISEGVPLSDPTLHQLLPRYDRTLGHLGYRYDPTQLKCRAIYFGSYGDADPAAEITNMAINYCWPWGMRCVWPAPENPKFPYHNFEDGWQWKWGLDSPQHPAPIDGFLPVVFNECAEIIPVNPTGSKRVELPDAPEDSPQPTHHHVGNVAFARHVQPEPGDKTFPSQSEEWAPVGSRSIWVFHDGDWVPDGAWDGTLEDRASFEPVCYIGKEDGYWLDAGPSAWVPPLRDFTHQTYILTHDFGQMSVLRYDEDYVNQAPNIDSYSFLTKKLDNRHFRPYEPGKPWPLADVVFAWSIHYLYYGRSRQQPSGYVPRRSVSHGMRSPVTISVIRFDCDYEIREFAWGEPGGDAPSIMMLEKPW